MALSDRALINADNIVENVILYDDEHPYQVPDGYTLGPAGANMGDKWDGTTYISTAPPAPPVNLPPPPPLAVSLYQVRVALMEAGDLDKVNDAIMRQGGHLALAWQYGPPITDNGYVALAIRNALNANDDSMAALFAVASKVV